MSASIVFGGASECPMKNMKLIARCFGLASLLFAVALLGGCAGPTAKASKYMALAVNVPTAPPAGKALVCIHRPRSYWGQKFYTGVWDGNHFIADLGNGHSVAYVCQPGRHCFLNLSIEAEGCVEADLLPDQTYDLWTDTVLATALVSFKIKPLHQDEATRQLVAKWTRKHRWVEPAPPSADYELSKQEVVRGLLEDFTSGKRQNKLQHLASEDHR
jgi:hypothetical protein